jgi:hypothetical protein
MSLAEAYLKPLITVYMVPPKYHMHTSFLIIPLNTAVDMVPDQIRLAHKLTLYHQVILAQKLKLIPLNTVDMFPAQVILAHKLTLYHLTL